VGQRHRQPHQRHADHRGHWNLVFSTTKQVPVARLLVNTPFDVTVY
jgi:hypothetical protein